MDYSRADRLIELRKKHGLSQEKLAEKIGVSRQSVSKWERGESVPETANVMALASLYGISMDELLGDGSAEKEVAENRTDSEKKKKRLRKKKAKDERTPVFPKAARFLFRFPFPVLVAVLYIAAGIFRAQWHPGWVLFLLIPAYYMTAAACCSKSLKRFFLLLPLPLYFAVPYLYLGFAAGIWHPYWLLFLAFPFYYWAAAVFVKK